MTPGSGFIDSGDSLTLVASGGGDPAPDLRWVSQDPEVARIGSPGIVIGGRAGVATVLAIQGQDTVTVSIQVVPGSPARVTLIPTSLRLAPGEGGQLEVTVTDAQGNLILDPGLEWSSNSTGVVEVDEGGFVQARGSGSAVIRASAADAWNQVNVNVAVSPGDVTPGQPPVQVCPDPVMDELDRLEVAMDDPSTPRQELRDGALVCWNRGQALSDQERAYAAWLIGLNTVNLEGCSQGAILWLDRAVRLEPGSEAYRVAREACGGGAP